MNAVTGVDPAMPRPLPRRRHNAEHPRRNDVPPKSVDFGDVKMTPFDASSTARERRGGSTIRATTLGVNNDSITCREWIKRLG